MFEKIDYNSDQLSSFSKVFTKLDNVYIDQIVNYLEYYKYLIICESLKKTNDINDISFRNGAVTSISNIAKLISGFKKEKKVNKLTNEVM